MALFAERVRKALGDLVFHIGNVHGSNIEEEKQGKGRNDGGAGRGGEGRGKEAKLEFTERGRGRGKVAKFKAKASYEQIRKTYKVKFVSFLRGKGVE